MGSVRCEVQPQVLIAWVLNLKDSRFALCNLKCKLRFAICEHKLYSYNMRYAGIGATQIIREVLT